MLFMILFCLFSAWSFSQCDSTLWAKEDTYEVYVIKTEVESTDVHPRMLSDEEKCLVANSRHTYNTIYLKLDTYTEVKIYSYSKLQEK